MYGKAIGYKLIAVPQLVHGTNQRASDIAHSVGRISHNPPSWSANNTLLCDFQRESLSSYVTAANAFIKLNHYADALISTSTREDRVGITVTK